MSWLNPWAWLGLFALAVPVLIHLFARRTARVQPFPTLRFVDATRLHPARRARITDPLLLLVRMMTLAAAVAALAQPHLRNSLRDRSAATLARAIIVDSSASMLFDTAAFAAARTAAARHAAEADAVRTLVAAEPARMFTGAAAWLASQPGNREIVIISDFRYGEFTAADIGRIPADIGVRFERIAAPEGSPSAPLKAAMDVAAIHVQLLAGPSDGALATATLHAAVSAGGPAPSDTTRRIAVVFPNHSQRAELLRTVQPPDAPWQGDLLMRLAHDTTVLHTGHTAIEGNNTLVLFTSSIPGTLPAAQLVTTILRATAQPAPEEFEPEVLADDVLKSWEREPAQGAAIPDDASQGRWLWLLVLLLLGIESWLRRRGHAPMENAG